MIEKMKTFDDRREEYFGATDGQEMDIRNHVVDDVADKINEIIDYLNETEK